VSVTDAAGEPVPGLTSRDFQIASDGTPLQITGVDAGPAPVSVALLFDVTHSSYNRLFLVEGLRHFVDAVVPATLGRELRATDDVRVGTFGRRTVISATLPPGVDPLRLALSRALDPPADQKAGPSPIWDAIDAAVSELTAEPVRRIVVVLSDGQVTGSRLAHDDVALRASAAGVVVSAVGLGGEQLFMQGLPFGGPPGTSRGPMVGARVRSDILLRAVTEMTGGMYLALSTAAFSMGKPVSRPTPGPLFAQLIRRARHSYAVRVEAPGADGRFHRLDVRVTPPGLVVQTRRWHVASAGQ
jgi:hypothetical protein